MHFYKAARDALVVVMLCFASAAMAQAPEPEPEPEEEEEELEISTPADARELGLDSLRKAIKRDKGVPLPDNLKQFVRDKQAAIQLGKALFWDMQVGSDAMQSCGTCHFHAGADSRIKNQLNPGMMRIKNQHQGALEGFSKAELAAPESFEDEGPNHTFDSDDFPFIKFPNKWVENADGTVGPWPGNTHNISGDAGIFFTLFHGVTPGQQTDQGKALLDPVWNVQGVTTRRSEPRNSPSMINAVLNFVNFWDGRAENEFNGVNNSGARDPEAKLFVSSGRGKTLKTMKLSMRNASLASQAVAPPLSAFEMSFGNGAENFRILPEVGRKLLSLNPLAKQKVSRSDSVLGALANRSGPGLDPQKFRTRSGAAFVNGYQYLIEKAFRPEYWESSQRVVYPAPVQNEAPGNQALVQDGPKFVAAADAPAGNSFSHMEANMALFFGVSIMLYESTLVSDQSPFDRWMEGDGSFVPGFGIGELRGLNTFATEGKCINCHGGPEFTNASVRSARSGRQLLKQISLADGKAVQDNGFVNISVTLTTDDLGRGGSDPFGQPLSFSRQVLSLQDGVEKNASSTGKHKGVHKPILPQRVAVDGAFKIPSLRNAELTGPYFHNGGAATLRQVVQFYDRGGNFPGFNTHDLDPDIQRLFFDEEEEEDLVRFLLSLTDPRVKFEAAPFDHPELFVPNGYAGDDELITNKKSIDGIEQAVDDILHVPEVGRLGRTEALKTFLDLDPQLGLSEEDEGEEEEEEAAALRLSTAKP